jgi:hypothetical protein
MLTDRMKAYASDHPEASVRDLMAAFPQLERDEALMLREIRSKPCGNTWGVRSWGNEMIGFGGRYCGNSACEPKITPAHLGARESGPKTPSRPWKLAE